MQILRYRRRLGKHLRFSRFHRDDFVLCSGKEDAKGEIDKQRSRNGIAFVCVCVFCHGDKDRISKSEL